MENALFTRIKVPLSKSWLQWRRVVAWKEIRSDPNHWTKTVERYCNNPAISTFLISQKIQNISFEELLNDGANSFPSDGAKDESLPQLKNNKQKQVLVDEMKEEEIKQSTIISSSISSSKKNRRTSMLSPSLKSSALEARDVMDSGISLEEEEEKSQEEEDDNFEIRTRSSSPPPFFIPNRKASIRMSLTKLGGIPTFEEEAELRRSVGEVEDRINKLSNTLIMKCNELKRAGETNLKSIQFMKQQSEEREEREYQERIEQEERVEKEEEDARGEYEELKDKVDLLDLDANERLVKLERRYEKMKRVLESVGDVKLRMERTERDVVEKMEDMKKNQSKKFEDLSIIENRIESDLSYFQRKIGTVIFLNRLFINFIIF